MYRRISRVITWRCVSSAGVAVGAVSRTRRKQIVKGGFTERERVTRRGKTRIRRRDRWREREGEGGGELNRGGRHFCRFRSFNGIGAPCNLFVSLVPRHSLLVFVSLHAFPSSVFTDPIGTWSRARRAHTRSAASYQRQTDDSDAEKASFTGGPY